MTRVGAAILTLVLVGCGGAKLTEVASTNMPTDVTWVMAQQQTLTRTLSDLSRVHFQEVSPEGVVQRERTFPGVYDSNAEACKGFSTADNPFFVDATLTKLNNDVLGQSPSISAPAIADLNKTKVGQFRRRNCEHFVDHGGKCRHFGTRCVAEVRC